MKLTFLHFVVLISIMVFNWSCTSVLTRDEIEDLDLKAIEDYVAANQLIGEYTSENIFISIIDTGLISFQIDSISQIDTLFIDTFYVDTAFSDTGFILDTILQEIQLIESLIPDTSLFYDNPSSQDTILLIFEIFDLNDRQVFTTNSEIFRRASGIYPTLSQLLSGLRKSLTQFSEGGKGIVLIPSEEAYGRVGNGTSLGSNTPIRIDFELVGYY